MPKFFCKDTAVSHTERGEMGRLLLNLPDREQGVFEKGGGDENMLYREKNSWGKVNKCEKFFLPVILFAFRGIQSTGMFNSHYFYALFSIFYTPSSLPRAYRPTLAE